MAVTPPPFEAVPGTIRTRITADYLVATATAVNLLYFEAPTETPTAADCEAVLDIVAEWINANYKNEYNANWKIFKLEAQGMEAAIAAYASRTVNQDGSLEEVEARPEWAPLILLGTGSTGRSRHGRVYTFPPDAAGVKDNNTAYSDAHMGDLVTDFLALITLANDGGYPLVVASPTQGSFHRVTGVTYSPRLTMQTRRRPNFGS